ncbi:hypothetical protein GS506_14975 [Rhodococcus hoagii]|nr:hypothetical protein [Prescottella equi]
MGGSFVRPRPDDDQTGRILSPSRPDEAGRKLSGTYPCCGRDRRGRL